MTECTVICRQCPRINNGRDPKRWDWLCEECMEEHVAAHKRETGHMEIDITVSRDDGVAERVVRNHARYRESVERVGG